MFFNVTLRQAFVYEDVIEADTKEEAERIARDDAMHNDLNWIPEGRLRTSNVEEAYVDPSVAKLTPEEVEDLDSCLTDMVMDFVFGDGDEDDPFGSAPQLVNA